MFAEALESVSEPQITQIPLIKIVCNKVLDKMILVVAVGFLLSLIIVPLYIA